MAQANEALLYLIADALQLTLHQVGSGYKTAVTVSQDVGPWSLKFEILGKTDVLEKDTTSFWVRVGRNLWLYLVATSQGKAVKVYVFDGPAAGLNKGLLATPCETGHLKPSIERLRKAHALCFQYCHLKQRWAPVQ